MTTTTYNSGSGNFVVPAGVTSLQIELWGGGGGGGQGNGSSAGAGGGGGGGYVKKNALVVTPSQMPQLAASRTSSMFVVSTKSFMVAAFWLACARARDCGKAGCCRRATRAARGSIATIGCR